MYLKFYFNLKKKILFHKLELLYKLYTLISFRYTFLKLKLKLKLNYPLTIFKLLILRQKCIISLRIRSSYKICSLSRFKIKEFLTLGFIPNLKKLSW